MLPISLNVSYVLLIIWEIQQSEQRRIGKSSLSVDKSFFASMEALFEVALSEMICRLFDKSQGLLNSVSNRVGDNNVADFFQQLGEGLECEFS